MTFRDLQPWQLTLADGVTVRGRRIDPVGDAPTLFFSHGNGFAGGVYATLLARLIGPFGLITHDFENHGESEVTGHYRGKATLLAQTCEVFDTLAPAGNTVLMGHSLGGGISTLLAAQRPEAVAATVLLDPILLPPQYWVLSNLAGRLGRNPMANAALRRRTQWVDRDALATRLKGRGIYAGWTDAAFEDFIDHATRPVADGLALICPSAIEAAIYRQPVYPWSALRRLRQPMLMLYGADSYGFFPTTARRVAAGDRKRQVERVPGGHCFMLEQPQDIAERIRRFLDALPSGQC
ncbi:alpha/beta fold hydrolase [Polycyclovorans algicola]|uniref:alpha/beta fold hydrolase n=1 Tax=Polycyclovorans algicola TaxID=616992 RepID=UPI0006938479|nr:alpha/beta hydrolase [Polycyclovorans algicola]